MPRDKRTRIPRRARKAAQEHLDNVQKAIDGLAALPGVADIVKTKRVPKGFYGLIEGLLEHHEAWLASIRKSMNIGDAKRPGSPGGCGACYAAPTGVHAVELLNIYRGARPKNDFPQLANKCASLAQTQMELIQENYKGDDPDKIRMASKGTQEALKKFAQLGKPCAFLDVAKERCKIWETRPLSCRMHHVTSDPAWTDPRHAKHESMTFVNIRLPLKVQAAVAQLEKRMGFGVTPFLYAGLLQIVQLNNGELVQEIGETPQPIGQDGRVAQRANRDKKGAKKFQKGKKSKRSRR